MRTSLGVRTMTANPSMCGNGSLGRQFSVSMRQMPETSISHPISTSPKASGQELASIGTIRDSHSSPSLSVEWLGDGSLRTTPLMLIGCPWYLTCTAARPCRSVRSCDIETVSGFCGGHGRPALSDDGEELGRQMARERLKRYRSVSGLPTASMSVPYLGGFRSARSIRVMCLSDVSSSTLSPCHTAMTRPITRRRSMPLMRAAWDRRIFPSRGTSNGSLGAGCRISMASRPVIRICMPVV